MTDRHTLNDLRRMTRDARQLAAGGLHANSADTHLPSELLMHLAEAVMHLNRAVACLENAPEFTVFEGAAGMLTDPNSQGERRVESDPEHPLCSRQRH